MGQNSPDSLDRQVTREPAADTPPLSVGQEPTVVPPPAPEPQRISIGQARTQQPGEEPVLGVVDRYELLEKLGEAGFGAAESWAKGVESVRAARAGYDTCLATGAWRTAVLSGRVRAAKAEALTALFAEHAAAPWAAVRQALAEAERLAGEGKWSEAVARYTEATGNLPEVAKTADTACRKGQYDEAMANSMTALTKKDWPGAESAFAAALEVEGYGGDATAKARQAEARLAQALATAEAAKAKGDWEAMRTAAAASGPASPTRPTGLTGPTAAAATGLLARLEALAAEADEHLLPRLEVRAELDGEELPGATVTVTPVGAPASARAGSGKTPCTVELGKGQTYKIEVARGPAEGQAWTVPELGMAFVWVPALKLWAGKYEVTNAEYRACKPDHDSKECQGHSLNGDRQPVVCVCEL